MAAVLCNGIGAFCNGLCTVLALPFKACGGCCKALGDACGGCCAVTGKACGVLLCQSPFTPYVITTLALQVGPIIWSILTVLDPAGEDCSFLNIWMYVFGLLSVLHIAGAFYIAFRMAEDLERNPPVDQTTNNNAERGASSGTVPAQSSSSNNNNGKYIWEHVQDFIDSFSRPTRATNPPPPTVVDPSPHAHRGGSNSWKRLGHLMCYDVGVALYMVLFLFWLVWIPVGVSTITSAENDEECDRVHDFAQSCTICGFVYAVLVALSFCCSLVFLRV